MTPEQHEHLRLLKAHLESLLETASKRTPGGWENDTGSVLARCLKDTPNFRRHIDGGFYLIVAESDNDATFIASCAGNAEAGWKSTLAAIEWLGAKSYADSYDSTLRQTLAAAILAAWPIETLKP